MLLNPYVSGNPLKDAEKFFGREDIIREVMHMLRHPDEKAIVLYGQRRIGKTSILLQLIQRLTTEGQFSPVFFDLQDRASSSLSDVLYKLAQTVNASLKLPMPDPDRFDEHGSYFQMEFLPEATRHAAPGGLVILFDEFDVMDTPKKGQAAQAFFPYLRNCLTDLKLVQFVFVIGRRPEELSTDTLSTFKGIRAARVSLLDHTATLALVRQSETKGSLFWSDAAIERVWDWTHGHTYCAQLICSVVWENMQEKSNSAQNPKVQPDDVDQAIPEALRNGANAFHWIWDGLPPAERVVMAAMAEVDDESINQSDIEEVLNKSGVRLIVRELKLAPATLVDWELLVPSNGGYRFSVPLLRQWVKINRPLIRTKEELDRLDPLAENLFQAGQSFYSLSQTTDAVAQLRQALTVNPNHLKSRLLLGRILLEQGGPDNIREASQILDEAYNYDPGAAVSDLVKTLLALSDLQEDEESRLQLYERILTIQPGQPTAIERRAKIYQARKQYWRELGEQALSQGDFSNAIQAFEKAGDSERIEQVRMAEHLHWIEQGELALKNNNFDKAEELFRLAKDQERLQKVVEQRDQLWITKQLSEAKLADQREDWDSLLATCTAILERVPAQESAQKLVEKARLEIDLAQRYEKGVELMAKGQIEKAQAAFVEIINIRPGYREATHYLDDIVSGGYQAQLPMKNWLRKAGLVVVAGIIQYIIYQIISIVFGFSFSRNFIILSLLPAVVTYLLVDKIRSGKARLKSISSQIPVWRTLPFWMQATFVRFVGPVVILFIIFLVIVMGFQSANGYLYYSQLIVDFLLYSLIPTGGAFLGIRLIWKRVVSGPKVRKFVTKASIPTEVQFSNTREVTVSPTPGEVMGSRAVKVPRVMAWIILTAFIFLISALIIFLVFFREFGSLTSFLVFLGLTSAITFFSFRILKRSRLADKVPVTIGWITLSVLIFSISSILIFLILSLNQYSNIDIKILSSLVLGLAITYSLVRTIRRSRFAVNVPIAMGWFYLAFIFFSIAFIVLIFFPPFTSMINDAPSSLLIIAGLSAAIAFFSTRAIWIKQKKKEN